ncbi:anaphase-promoting complex subunit cdc27 [Scheffersomyces spartinae]|uniref:Anaphase-promoting complex subunit cdc27 n=1 Tax=Scheffersomyces spartinae TaxID=45513 RepID=A0A9P8AJX6_9ASCO|nr:anaphase-promoting complex subunit cdc27 [Scheffersomyces spartinae]KAG7195256.1 anaphase-promoting complex subunit cdc27 [Scheffersomyces spartinae]
MQPPPQRSDLHMQGYLRSILIHSIDNFNFKNAEFAGERLLALDPKENDLLYLYCLSLYHLGKYQTCYNRLVDCKITHLGCSYLFARCCLQLDKFKEGVYHLTKIHYLYEDGTNESQGFVDLKQKLTYEHHRSIYPDSSVVYHVLGDLYKGMNDVKNSSLSYAECLKFNQFDFEALQKLCKLGVDIRVKAIYKANAKIGVINNFKTSSSSSTTATATATATATGPVYNNNTLADNESGLFSDTDTGHKERILGGLNIAIDDSFKDTNQSSIWNPFTNSPTKGVTSPKMTPTLRGDPGLRNQQQKRPNTAITPRMRSTSTGELPSAPVRKTVHNLSATFEFPKPTFPITTDSSRQKQKDRNINITSRLISQPSTTARQDLHLNPPTNPKSTPATKRSTGSMTPLINTPAPIGGAFTGVDNTRTLKRTSSSTLIAGKEANLLPGAAQTSMGLFTSKEIEQAGIQLINLYTIFAKGFKAMCKFDCYKAIRIFDSLPEREKRTPWILSKLGRLHYEIVNYKQSEYYFVQLRQVDRTRLEDMEYFSTLLWHLQKKVELTYLANELHDIDSNSSITWCVIGNLYSLMREPDEAIKCFTKATKLDPKFVYAYTLRGHEYFGNDNYEMALENFRISLLYDARHYNALYGIGMVYINLGEYTKADYHFRKAVAINPINVILICCVGMIFEKLGKKPLALKQYELATKLQPLNPLPIFKKAQLLFSMQQFTQALRYLEELAQLAPDEASVHFLLGQLYNIQNNKFMALKEFTIALNLDPKGNFLIREAMESMRNNTTNYNSNANKV